MIYTIIVVLLGVLGFVFSAFATPLQVVITEIAWMGTEASATDEWIELFNPRDESVDLNGWTLRWNDHVVRLSGTIPAGGYFLLERTDDDTVADIDADLIYSGGLRNGGEVIELLDANDVVVDSANADGGVWPAGHNANRATMQRIDATLPDTDDNWQTTTAEAQPTARDASGNVIRGTPRAPNGSQPPISEIVNRAETPSPSETQEDESSQERSEDLPTVESFGFTDTMIFHWIWVTILIGVVGIVIWRTFIR